MEIIFKGSLGRNPFPERFSGEDLLMKWRKFSDAIPVGNAQRNCWRNSPEELLEEISGKNPGENLHRKTRRKSPYKFSEKISDGILEIKLGGVY